MLDGVFARGTTPTQVFPLPGDLIVDEFVDFSIAYRQKKKLVLVKHKKDLQAIPELNYNKNLILVLSQEDTLLFNPNIEVVEVQIKGSTVGSDVFTLGEYRLRLDNIFDENEFDLR